MSESPRSSSGVLTISKAEYNSRAQTREIVPFPPAVASHNICSERHMFGTMEKATVYNRKRAHVDRVEGDRVIDSSDGYDAGEDDDAVDDDEELRSIEDESEIDSEDDCDDDNDSDGGEEERSAKLVRTRYALRANSCRRRKLTGAISIPVMQCCTANGAPIESKVISDVSSASENEEETEDDGDDDDQDKDDDREDLETFQRGSQLDVSMNRVCWNVEECSPLKSRSDVKVFSGFSAFGVAGRPVPPCPQLPTKVVSANVKKTSEASTFGRASGTPASNKRIKLQVPALSVFRHRLPWSPHVSSSQVHHFVHGQAAAYLPLKAAASVLPVSTVYAPVSVTHPIPTTRVQNQGPCPLSPPPLVLPNVRSHSHVHCTIKKTSLVGF